jgi:AraC family transcriptional regulator
MTLPVVSRALAGVAVYPPGATYGPRRLRDHEFVWLLQGSADWTAGAERIHLEPGWLLLLRPGTRDRFDWDRERPTRHAYCHFTVPESDRPAPVRRLRPLTPGGPLESLCRYLLALHFGHAPNAADRLRDVLGLLLAVFDDGPVPEDDAALAPLPAPLERAIAYINGQWSVNGPRAIGLEELGTAAAVSPTHLSRLFRAHLGMGAAAIQERLRLARAATLLRRSNLSVAAVSDTCGFANPYHFSHRFRVVAGVSPSVYRNSAETAGELLLDGGLERLGALMWTAPDRRRR